MSEIRLVTFYEESDCWNSFDDKDDRDIYVQLSEYVFNHIDHIDNPGFEVEDFEVPDNLTMEPNKQFVADICRGRSFNIWNEAVVDFNSQYYEYWIFIKNKENSWEEF